MEGAGGGRVPGATLSLWHLCLKYRSSQAVVRTRGTVSRGACSPGCVVMGEAWLLPRPPFPCL